MFEPLLEPARYKSRARRTRLGKIAFLRRTSGRRHARPNAARLRSASARRSERWRNPQSALIESKIASLGVGSGFKLFSDKIETPGDGIIIFRGMQVRADFQHLRRWRKSVEQAQSYTFKAVITVIATGFVGAVWLGIKVTLGK